MKHELVKHVRQARRVLRVRKSVSGTTRRPRLAVARTLKNITAQIIDDDTGRTLCSASTQSRELRAAVGGNGGNAKAAQIVGKALGDKARALGIECVAFDRRGRKYHGRVKALADAAREAGLKF
ncbi:MAG: 50S ribosomal protein L18 [Phycisphaerales bacterium]|nr:50S ribosomal protein L18 [Phycisphaerales bacterium]